MNLSKLIPLAYLTLATPLFSATKFRYDNITGVCKDHRDRLGYNRDLGECSDFSGQRIPETVERDFSGSLFSFSIFSPENQYRFTIFQGVDMQSSIASEVVFESVNFERILCSNADFASATISFSTFTNTKCSDANFEDAKLEGTRFSDSDMRYSVFIGVNANRSDFSGVNLRDSLFEDATVDFASFENADLRGADMRVISSRSTIWLGAKFDELTDLPFSIESAINDHGMIWRGEGQPICDPDDLFCPIVD
ncbi:MAG: pentapeptide repeat-containing protein [Pseudobacteriovorax sp.]|nr:pentapeptide repeat-containing protein [Pseudobacteriovorax sp.]